MSKPNRSNPLRAALLGLLMATAGAALGFLVARYGMEIPFVRSRLSGLNGWDLLALPLIGLLVIAVHEGGHLLAGMSRGMRFLLYIAGPFQWSRGESGVHFSWAFNLGTLGGVAACTPDPDRPVQAQLRWLVAGGPLASLLLTLVAVGLAAIVEGRPAAYALIVGLLSLAIFCVTAVPMRAGGFMSDGMQFLELLRGGRGVEERNVLMGLMGQSLAGVRPAQLDQRLITQALAFANPEPLRAVAARLYAFLHAWDSADGDRAHHHAAWLGEHIGDYPDGFRQSLAIELALYAALEREDSETAHGWLQRSRGGVVEASRRALAEAAVAACEERRTDAEQALEAAERALPRGMDRGLAQFSRRQIDALRRKLRDPTASVGMSQIVAKAV